MKYVVLALTLLIIPMIYAQDVDNILQNSDFEAGVVAGWSMWVEGQGVAVALREQEENEPFEGTISLVINIDNAGNGQRVELHQNPLTLKKNNTYTYAFWAKADPGRPAKMICNHREAPWTGYTNTNINLLEEWQEFWATFDMPEDDVKAGIYVELRDNKEGLVWFDRFRLYEGEYFKEDLGIIELAVEPEDKLTTTWGNLKHQER